jgi:hypothetical protein
MADKQPSNISEYAKRLFILSLVDQTSVNPVILQKVKNIVTMIDNSTQKIPPSWKAKDIIITNDEKANFQGTIYPIVKTESAENLKEYHVIGYEENTKSVWRFIFDKDYAIPMQSALSVKLKGGKILKILSRTVMDPPYIRGTLILEQPAFQVDVQQGW